jgi:hypothetical protein
MLHGPGPRAYHRKEARAIRLRVPAPPQQRADKISLAESHQAQPRTGMYEVLDVVDAFGNP